MTTFTNPIYEFLEISPQNEIELFYLINLSKRLGTFKNAQNHIFDFHPRFDDKGRSQTFSSFYKEALLSEILWKSLILVAKHIVMKNNIEAGNFEYEDFSLFFYDKFLDNKEEDILIKYFLSTDLSFFTIEMFIYDFYIKNKDYLSSY